MTQPFNSPIFRPSRSNHALSLTSLFQILTGCCVFFACLKLSPALAIAGTLILTPAIIRTGLGAELHAAQGLEFCWKKRLRLFALSVAVVLFMISALLLVFCSVSVAFGLVCVLIVLINGQPDLWFDVGIMGSVGGMVWGFAAMIVTFSVLCQRYWMPVVTPEGVVSINERNG